MPIPSLMPQRHWVHSRVLIYPSPTRLFSLFPLLQGTYVDKKCPFTGNVSIRGRILKGVVVSTKMNRTVVIRRDYLRYITKYRRYEKRHKTLPAHCSPAFLVKEGDVVTVGQCRPLSKTVRFNVLKVESATEAGAARAKKTFRVF
jgi:small subunit ribosomal protein S11e